MNFFEQPIINSPYEAPTQHWDLDPDGRPTNRVIDQRRKSELISPVPASRRKKATGRTGQAEMDLGGEGLSTADQEYNPTPEINDLRQQVETWRNLPKPEQWQVSPETARLLRHWRHHQFQGVRPFFCQVEAVETAIWLAEVAPKAGQRGRRALEYLQRANDSANPDLFRIALKLATGAGKTTVMAMLIAWQVVNAVRYPNSRLFSRGFLIVAPGITIRDRLRVLQPNDPDSYYAKRELVPTDLLPELNKAKIVITNYHAFKLRERVQLARGTRSALEGHAGPLATEETEGQMLQRVMPELMGLKNVVVLNDEAHHCYREKPAADEVEQLAAEEKREAEKNKEAARLWISGIEAVKRHLGVRTVYDLSATPFFLSGSGYIEGTLFPWVASDFSLIDAIECGIVKLPRVPVADTRPEAPQPLYRDLWKAIGKRMPKKTRGEKKPDPLKLPLELQTAIDALYGHYEKTYEAWRDGGVSTPPVFIVVCNNTTNSELLYEYIAGFEREDETGAVHHTAGRLPLFRNHDEHGNRLPRPRTLIIDSVQIESGGTIDDRFRAAAGPEIEQFRRERAVRDPTAGPISDEEILREAMNTVGKHGRLGEQIRCVVSVSMLTEGWDANTVTHIMGIRAFGTKLICEQVMGRALRRLSYDVDPGTGLFGVEYADIMGIDGLNFSGQAIQAPIRTPRDVIHVHAVSPERDHLEITFPHVEGYRVELPAERLAADFSQTEPYVLTQEKVGPCEVTMQGIFGMPEDLSLEYLKQMRRSELIYRLASHLLMNKLRDAGEQPKLHLFGQCRRLVKQWLDGGHLVCKDGTVEAQLGYKQLGDEVCDLILGALSTAPDGQKIIRAILDPYNQIGSTSSVNFNTTQTLRLEPRPDKSHVNWMIFDSDWEREFAEVVQAHPRVIAFARNHNLGLEIPYLCGGEQRRYLPDFVARVDDGRADPLNLLLEVKGYRGHDAMLKAETTRNKWVPAVNRLGRFGRWAFAEFRSVGQMEQEFRRLIERHLAEEPA